MQLLEIFHCKKLQNPSKNCNTGNIESEFHINLCTKYSDSQIKYLSFISVPVKDKHCPVSYILRIFMLLNLL